MPTIINFINRLLPFATPGTPLLQDLVHLGVICGLLYFAPQIQEWLNQRKHQEQNQAEEPQPTEFEPVHAENDTNHEVPEIEGEANNLEANQNAEEEEAAPNNADFLEFQRQQENLNNNNDPGPANAAQIPNQRNVGAKKAKSLAKKDQRRAYHEFQRAQGEAQRARDAEGASEREAAQAAERERRKAAEAKLEAKKAKEREEKRERERREREREFSRRELAVGIVKRELEEERMSNLFDVARTVGGEADEVWVEKMLNASGVLGRHADSGSLTMITSTGWVVRVSREDMVRCYQKAAEEGLGDENGKIGYEEIGGLLERILRKRDR